MRRMSKRKKIVLILASLGVLVAGVGVWGLVVVMSLPHEIPLPPGLSAAELQADWDKPAVVLERVRLAMQQPDLTLPQRRQLEVNLLRARAIQLNQQVEEYAAAPQAEREAILDRHLDAMHERFKETQRQQQAYRQWQASVGGGSVSYQGAGALAASTEGGAGSPVTASSRRQLKKTCSESRDPDKMAQWLDYAAALRKRADDRGLGMLFPAAAR